MDACCDDDAELTRLSSFIRLAHRFPGHVWASLVQLYHDEAGDSSHPQKLELPYHVKREFS
jgi:hypothetical protein